MTIHSEPIALPQTRGMAPWQPGLGIAYLWVLNDACEPDQIERFARAFADRGVSAVCLHPRSGLEVPYGSDEWFELIASIVERCEAHGVETWLYDEDPFPSGAAGGRITAENPELAAHSIACHQADATQPAGELFHFPTGKLLWCGVVNTQSGQTRELTGRVGMIRRRWNILDPWDSRHYYPGLPLYSCPRAHTDHEEYAVRLPELAPHETLYAFVARPIDPQHEHWSRLPDSMNPQTTQRFLQLTHERYRETLGEKFGRQIPALFIDEPKVYSPHAWTPGMFESFEARYGYDLGPRLWHLFTDDQDDPVTSLTRLHHRDWCRRRFTEAWLRPVADWCDQHRLALVGHMSPEDDPVQQSHCLGNLMRLHQHMTLPGLDLIVPAVGDAEHAMLSVGVVGAVSVQQQTEAPGVLSEMLACAGREGDSATINRVLRWQTLMGVNAPIVHGAFNSMHGNRAIDAPPDYGPDSAVWDHMLEAGRCIAEAQQALRDAKQVAPVAILWPIRSFAAQPVRDMHAPSPLRDHLVQLLHACLSRQVGVHFIDEADLCRGQVHDGALTLGKARYTHIVVPEATVWARATIDQLAELNNAGVNVSYSGQPARWIDEGDRFSNATPAEQGQGRIEDVVPSLPRLLDAATRTPGIRCTAWDSGGARTYMLMNISKAPHEAWINDQHLQLAPDAFQMVRVEAAADDPDTMDIGGER